MAADDELQDGAFSPFQENAPEQLFGVVSLLRATLEATNDAILVTDFNHNVLVFNKRFVDLWHLPKLVVDAGNHDAILAFNSRFFADPNAFVARAAEIHTSNDDVFDELRLNDGRIFERSSNIHKFNGRPIGRVWSVRDVTKARMLEEAQSRLVAIVDSADDAIVGKTLTSVITSWNRGAQLTFGYSSEEAIGQSIRMLIPPELQFEEDEILERLNKGERIDHYQTDRIRKDGTRITVSISVSPVKDAAGQIIGGAKIARDISSQRRGDEIRGRLAAIIDSSEDAIISKTLQGVITSWNAAAERLFGYAADEAIGKSILMLFPPECTSEETTIIDKLSRGERIEHYQAERIRQDGTRVRLSLSISPIKDSSGQIIGVSKIARDITQQIQQQEALKESEERLRAVLEASPECVKIVAANGALQYMNQAGLCMIEYAGDPAPVGASVYALIAPEHRQLWIENHQRICAGERLNWEFEIIGRKGARRWMESHAVPLRQPDGGVAHLAVTRDISARRAHEEDRESLLDSERAARSEAERASQLKDEFLATLSHELRTPLNAILGWSQLLSANPGSVDLREGLDAIQRNARAQTQLIEDLLDMSRIISGKVRLDVQSANLAEVIDAAVESVRLSAEAKGIRLRKILDFDAGPVSGDPTRLQQVLWNLLSNAIKFTPKDGKVDVLLERVNSHLEITIHDSGVGIKAEFLPSVFERFRQADASTTRSYGGLGLGLSIVKHLVELHGGTVRAKSPGENLGATFVVSLPLAPVRRGGKREHPQAPRAPVFDCQEVSLDGVKVLVLDDEPDARALISRLLSQCKAEVVSCESADDALAEVRQFKPDVVISDIGMPGKDGYQFLRELRLIAQDIGQKFPAIALTAFARSEDRTRAMMAGYQIHIAKPIEPQELLATVASLAGRTG